jgi:FdhE protein
MTFAEQVLPSATTPATLLTPKADLFATRARRLRHLASGHSLGPWLAWLAELGDAQQQALNAVPDLGLNPAGAAGSANYLLNNDNVTLRQAWHTIYGELADLARNFGLGTTGARPFTPLDLTLDELDLKGCRCLELAAGEAAVARRDVTDILVAAALQVVWTAAARQLALPEVTHLENHDFCPCCGSSPVGSIVMAGEGKSGLRYLECSLCATRWNAVRAHCTLCAEGSVVHYLGVEGGNEAVQAETCDRCHGYIKTFFQNKDVQVDPVADDLASLALDVLVGEQGYARAAPNLFLSEGEAV